MSLVGEYECTIDAKNRLMVPADFRREVERVSGSPRWFVILHLKNRLWLMPEDEFTKQSEKFHPTLLPKDEQLDFVRKLFERSRLVEPDKQGRIVLPEKLLTRAGLGKEVTLVGVGRHAEVYDRQQLQAEQAQDNFDELYRKAREAVIETT